MASEAIIKKIHDRLSSSIIGKLNQLNDSEKSKLEKFVKQLQDDPNKSIIDEFIVEADNRILMVFFAQGDKLQCSLEIPANIKKKAIYFLKSAKITDALKEDDFKTDVLCCEVSESVLQTLQLISQEVYYPLLSNPSNRNGWSGPTSKEIMLKLSSFLATLTLTLGESKGQTLLPYPPPEAFDEDNLAEKERMHLLETAVVQWAHKIQSVLQSDPEQALKQGEHPGPMIELDFWSSKSADLHHLYDQLISEKMKSVVERLNEMKSPFASQFDKLITDVANARDDAAENKRYLSTLKLYFNRLGEDGDFSSIESNFSPMMHVILLICQNSKTYNNRHRLSCLFQEISNALVIQAHKFVSGENIFRLIEDENVGEAVHLLKSAVRISEKFKDTFARYQHKASTLFEDNPFDIPKETIFQRLDNYLERCSDILEFLNIVVEFSKLEKIFLGGTKGKQLTQSLRQVHSDFVKAVEQFKHVPYDIMDIQQSAFDDDFYKYRCQVKELERRLSAVVCQAFDDANTITARFKLLDSFEGLLERPIIKDELDKKQQKLLDEFHQEVRHVQELFHSKKNSPRIESNMAPVSGALAWCRSLADRLRDPYEKLRLYLAAAGLEREESKEIERIYSALSQQLNDYEQKKIAEWTRDIDKSIDEKLRQPLLRREANTRMVQVNFDESLVRLLREVKYFLLLRIQVPTSALSIYEKAEQYRTQIGHLEVIQQMYNDMEQSLHSTERPLVEKDIAHIDEVLEQGISALNWSSPNVNDFIKEVLDTVKGVYNTVKIMKDNFSTIKKIMNEFSQQPLIERKNKPLSPADFEENLRKLWSQRHTQVAEHQETVTKLLLETNQALKVNKQSPIWRSYVDFVQDSIRDGLTSTIAHSIKFLCDQLDVSNIEKNNVPSLLEIKIGLYANDVLFNAEDGASSNNNNHTNSTSGTSTSLNLALDDKTSRKGRRDVWQIVNDWVEQFFEIGNIMTRADGTHYTSDLKKQDAIVKQIHTLKKHLDANQKSCEDVRQQYLKYEFLWKSDRQAEFQKFLSQGMKKKEEEKKEEKKQVKKDDDEEQDEENVEDQIDYDVLKVRFEEKIQYYKDLLSEINNKPSPMEIGWLKINAQPIKAALGTWVSRWIHTYTSYLYNDVTRKLQSLEQLMEEVNSGLLSEVQPGDSTTLKRVLGYIHAIRSREKSTPKMFSPLRDMVALLKKFGRSLDDYELRLLNEAPMKWDATVNNVYKVKEKVNNLQNDEVDKIKAKVRSFDAELKAFRREFRDNAPFSYDFDVVSAYEVIYEYHIKMNTLEERASKLNDLEKVFELTVSKHRQIKKTRQENKLLKQLWDLIGIVRYQFEDWKKTLWDQIDTDSLLSACKRLQKLIQSIPQEIQSWDAYQGLNTEVKNLMTVLPLAQQLHSPDMEDRHWRELQIATGKFFNKDANFCLSNLLELELHKHVNDVEYIVELARKEAKIAAQLKKIEGAWSGLTLEFTDSGKGGVSLIQRPDEILTTLEEHMSMLQAMQGQGKYVEHFIEVVTRWQRTLNKVETVLYDWLDVQSKWNSLETIFTGSQDIRTQLPEDCERFDKIDKNFRQLMATSKNTPSVIEACSAENRSDLLQNMKTGLDMCEKSLFMYLETKRKAFPRFYFLSNASLLDILSNGHDPQAVQKHMGDCFDGIARLNYRKDDNGKFTRDAFEMQSKEGAEFVGFLNDFNCSGPVEEWLTRLEIQMKVTLQEITSRAKFTADHWEIEKPRPKWLFDYPAQVALTASQIIWTEEVNSQFDAFADGNEQAMKEYYKVLVSRLDSLIQLVLGELTHCDRVKIITIITVDVHNRDVVQKLIDQRVQDASSFQWQSQMRFSWKADTKDVLIKIADATFNYSYEYIGNTGRLVITPLTDRCYITLTQALRLIMGGAPAGPAGTGKTETTKDLGRALGLPVYVFNCSEQMNVQSLGSIFKGLCQTGAWGCFDEFNRIPIEVLSVVSTQVSCILNAIKEKRSDFDFMGEGIKIIHTVGMFITMNPGYAGRTELPENLKALFRSCAMVVPDFELICENMLMSEGFLSAQRLAKKFVTLYSLSSQLLSAQRHYDWGLRATKAVLRVAGGLKRAEPKVEEDRILMRALRDFNLPKLVDDDKPIFRTLVDDLFPGFQDTLRKVDLSIQENLHVVASKIGLQPEEAFILKCIDLYELMQIRHSVFIIGPPGCGKSEMWKCLFATLKHMGKKGAYEVLNPKAIRNDELYGWLSKTDWHDGILSTIMRNMSKNRLPYSEDVVNKWLILDGDIDPNWIESLNSVMDDNKVLTLVSNERIPMTPSMRLIFEISNLNNATPATVSRAGIVFINSKDIGWKPFLDSWIEKRENEKEKSQLLALINRYTTPELLAEIQSAFKFVVPVSEINMIRTMCYLLEGLLARADEHKKAAQRNNEEKLTADQEKELFEANFVFACVWAFGGACMQDKTTDYVKEFSEWWKRTFTNFKFGNNKDGTVFDYFPDKTGKMVPFSTILPEFVPPHDAYLVSKVFVPTADTIKMQYVMDLLVQRQRAVMIVGSAGTGKTAMVNQYLRSLPDTNFMYANINLNYYTDAKSLQRIMESYIDKRTGRIFGPPGTKKLIYFIDDLNMPMVDIYGTQSPSCLIRQHMDYQGWYDVTKLELKIIQDVQYISCMNPTAGSFNIDNRLQGQYTTMACLLPNKKTLATVYATVLDHHFKNFGSSLFAIQQKIVQATIELHDLISTKFVPSSKKFHYQFNLRDLSSVFQGVCCANVDAGLTPKSLVQLWQHECRRVFSDRMINSQDEDIVEELLVAKTRGHFKDAFKDAPNKDGKAADEEKVIFTSFHGTNAGIYQPVDTMEQLKVVLDSKLRQYNDANAVMNLELFGIAMEHICRITRIIENPRGNALLVGVGGSGKQSLSKLASFICGYDIFQISVTSSYGMNDLRADLQTLYIKAGVKNIPVTFILTDSQIVNDQWLVYINDLLASGLIPDLFNAEDKDGIIAQVRNEARSQGVPDIREALFEYFINQVRTNLHVVLCFSPVGDKFRIRCRKFPGLINCTNIDWFHPWPRDALVSVARRFLSDVNLNTPEIAAQLPEHMAEVHLSVNDASVQYQLLERRYNYTTPKSFLELISYFKLLLDKKRADLAKQSGRLEKGIQTLKTTQAQVAVLKEELTVKLVKVSEKAEAASQLIAKMGVERKKVEEQQALASIEADKATAVSNIATQIAKECDADLAKALPILKDAEAAVNCLDKSSLTALKSFTNPPENVLYVTNACLTLKKVPGKKDWNAAKKMMGNISQFLDELKTFDATSIDEDTLKKLQPTLEKDFFNSNDMKAYSEAAANLCAWVVNICKYNVTYKDVAPKMAAQKKANEEYDAAMAKLRVVQEKVEAMQAKLKSVTDSLKDATDEKNRVEAEAQSCQDRLSLARRLVDGLADENERWGKSIQGFQERARTLVGDAMLAASFVSYIGAFNQKFRNNLWRETWLPDLNNRQIPLTPGVDPLFVLASDSDFAKWKNEGLAADRVSLENGAILTQCSRWPLMIDPQLQGIKWIKNRVKNLKIVQLSQKKWLTVIQNAVEDGDCVIIESCGEEFDASLDPVLNRAVIQRGSSKVLKFGADEIRYNDNFRLFLQTKLSNPHYKPEVAAQCTLINFIVTEEGLEDQLLALVVNKEKPELEEKRTALVRTINDYMVSLTDLENELLERLSNAPEDILSDTALIEGLEKTKLAATEIEQKVELAKKQEITINAARNEYRMVAAEASWLYFLLIQLNIIDHMYQYSLDAFLTFFLKAIARAKKADSTPERVAILREAIRFTVFTWVNRGLFERHKLIFSSQLAFKLMQKGALKETFDASHYDFLIRSTKKYGIEKPAGLDWLPSTAWSNIQSLIGLEGFQKLAADMAASPNRFKEWYLKSRPESTPLPLDWRKLDETSPFMKLLVVRAMRLDRMSAAMEQYVAQSLPNGTSYTECDAGKSFLDVLTMSLDDSSPVIPIFFILSAGADPVQSVEVLAKRNGVYEGKFHRVALGEGQDVVAMARLEIGHKEGHWVVLENIHLMPRWTRELEKKLDEYAAEGSHPDFRVFLSAEPSSQIPIGLLERSIKLTNEPPQGLKQNLKRAFASFEKDEFEFKDPKVKSILFGLCHFHSVIIERMKFGPKGWNRAYPFSTGDLMCSSAVLSNYLDNSNGSDKVPWKDLRYIFGEILYGGHITDDLDRLLCTTYLEFYMREELLDEMELFPFNENFPEERFRSPPVLPYDQYPLYVDSELKHESPVAYGLHPNAEIAVKSKQASDLFTAILELQPRSSSASSDSAQSPQATVQTLIQQIVNDKTRGIEGINFNLDDIAQAVVEDRGPFQNVFIQECDRMNQLCAEIRRSLRELDLGLSGELQMSERMETLFNDLYMQRVPETWARLAYPSIRSMASWVDNLIQRAQQLQTFCEDPTNIPLVTNIGFLFNPQSFLTAIMQRTAQKQKLELDKLTIATDVTRKTVEQVDSRARDGAYITGLFLEGARWNVNAGILDECLPREMFFAMPVILARAILVDKVEKTGVYRCPVYKTPRRGPTFVFTAPLRTKAPAAKWILAGAVMTLEVDE